MSSLAMDLQSSAPPDTINQITSQGSRTFKPNYSETWLDEKCLTPFVNVTGFSRLCNACIHIFESGIIQGPWLQRHVKHLDTLLHSADKGCIICNLLLNKIRRRDLPCTEPLRVLYCFVTPRDSPLVTLKLYLGQHTPFLDLDLVASSDNYFKDSVEIYPVLSSTSSVNNQLLARRWFHCCRDTHEKCWSKERQSSRLPTRLVEVYSPTVLRIVETTDLSCDEAYIALSYCWGKAKFLSLKKKTMRKMSKEIQLSGLPKTFQDVVAIAGWFEVKYLWIDSMCIIQDSREDWQRESQRMGTVYRNAYITISATGAVNPTAGCFFQRNCDLVRGFKTRMVMSDGIAYDYIGFNKSFWSSNITDSPLAERAWALQERLLSPRVLHFGQRQMAWECQEISACETFPRGLPDDCLAVSDSSVKRILVDSQRSFLRSWTDVVQSYSRLSLTEITDRCVAFAGIAEEAQILANRQGCESQYFAGFWRHTLEQQLIWATEPGGGGRKTTKFLAPSFSWLSIKGHVTFPALDTSKTITNVLLEILDIRVDVLGHSIFGPINQGSYIEARGTLGYIQARRTFKRGWEVTPSKQTFEDERTPRGPAIFDNDSLGMRGDITALPVLECGSEVHGLLLKPNPKGNNEYIRVGKFLMNIMFDSWGGEWKNLPRLTFTIV